MLIRKNEYEGKINIYCNSEVAEIIPTIYKMLLRKSQSEIIDSFINIIVIKDNEKKSLMELNLLFLILNLMK